MNSPTPSSSRLRTLLTLAGLTAGAALNAQTIFSDGFDFAETFDPEIWGVGATGSIGVQENSASYAYLATGGTGANLRSGAVTHRTDFNPFETPFQVTWSDIYLTTNPKARDGVSPSCGMYGVIGRYAGDEGGPATGALASSFGGGGAYPGSLGWQILQFYDGHWRFQILDCGNAKLSQVQLLISEAPSSITMGIDGTTNQFYFEIEGATFNSIALDQLGITLQSDTLLTGSLVNLTEAGLTLADESTVVSRLALGAYNGSYETSDETIAELDAVTIEPYEAPDVPLTSIFSEYELTAGWRNTSFIAGSGIGWIHDGAYPYIWSHDAQGWLYIMNRGATASAFWAWHYNENTWIWSSVDWGGYYWNPTTGSVETFSHAD